MRMDSGRASIDTDDTVDSLGMAANGAAVDPGGPAVESLPPELARDVRRLLARMLVEDYRSDATRPAQT